VSIRFQQILVFVSLLSGCVLPPSSSGPRVLGGQEAKILDLARRGKDLAQAGRFEKAELPIRLAIRLATRDSSNSASPSLLNDLAFVLRATGQTEKALELSTEAVRRDPYSLQYRENLARTLYELGELDKSLVQFLRTEGDYFGYWKGNPDPRLAMGYSTQDLISLYRNIAILYAQLGQIAEAICYSEKALQLNDASYPAKSHARFLVSLEELSKARSFLEVELASTLTPEHSKLIDFAAVLLLVNENNLAKVALDRTLSEVSLMSEDRELALLLRYLLAERVDDTNTIYNIQNLAGDLALCESKFLTPPTFWPNRLSDEAVHSKKALCAQTTE